MRIFGVVFSVEDKNVLSNQQMDRASNTKDREHMYLMLNLVLVFLRLDRLFSFSGIEAMLLFCFV